MWYLYSGFRKNHYNHDEFVFEKFNQQLNSSLKNLDQKQEVREAYESVIKDQLENNIIEEINKIIYFVF